MALRKIVSRRPRFISLAVAIMLALLCATISPAGTRAAGTWFVAPPGDDGADCQSPATPCRTIRATIGKARAGDTIVVAAGNYAEQLVVRMDLTIVGAGAATTIVRAPAGTALTVYARAAISELTLTGGTAVGAGGGITNYGTLALTRIIIRDNSVTLGEGAQGFGGGIYNSGSLEVRETIISGNTARGAGVDGSGSGQGGGVYNSGTLAIAASTLSGNGAHSGGGIYNAGTLTVTNSTISGNQARGDGGGLINTADGTTALVFTTVAENVADSNADGIGAGAGIAAAGRETSITGTIVAANRAPADRGPDCVGTLISGGDNLVQDAADCTLAGTPGKDIVGKPARLGGLANNGGVTATHALETGSPALDAVVGTCPATDQRGVARPQGTACDIGSFEAATALPPLCPCSLWDDAARPALLEDPDTVPVELGVKFRSDRDGYIAGLRFYKGPRNTGTHTGTLWSNDGQPLATATFASETAEGWQEVAFASPVAIEADTTYVASYHTDVGRYAVDEGFFAAGVDRGPLHAPADGAQGGNGVYRYGASGFPTETYRASNYWVDVVFVDTVTWQITDLGTLGGDVGIATGINKHGEIVGASTVAPGQWLQGAGMHAFVWREGEMTDLGTLPGGALSQAFAINDEGHIVGDGDTREGARHAVLWSPGHGVTDLGTLGGRLSSAADINNRGQIVGSSTTAAGTTHAFLWQEGAMTDLGTLGGDASAAVGINDRGQIVGYSQDVCQIMHAVLWDDGEIEDLGALPGGIPSIGTGFLSRGTGLNSSGEVVGTGLSESGARAFVWRGGAFTVLDPPTGGISSFASAINDRGQIAGGSTTTGGSDAVLWGGESAINLGALPAASYSFATAINDDTHVVGASGNTVAALRPVLWRMRPGSR